MKQSEVSQRPAASISDFERAEAPSAVNSYVFERAEAPSAVNSNVVERAEAPKCSKEQCV